MKEYDEWHDYGLVKITATQYEKCFDACCKSGGYPPQYRRELEAEE